MGPSEKMVRLTLPDRPAAVLYGDDRRINHCFAGLFNGARTHGWLTPNDGLFLGKAECEWDWREVWGAMRDMGLVEWRLEDKPNHPDHGGTTTHFYWNLTQKGADVREDDNKYFVELMSAMTADRQVAGAD